MVLQIHREGKYRRRSEILLKFPFYIKWKNVSSSGEEISMHTTMTTKTVVAAAAKFHLLWI